MSVYTLHVISHTHWDREWYLSFQALRLRLVDLIDNLLDLLDRDPEFRFFHLDGQTIVLEDYLEIKPENEERLRKHIRSGRILIGPWYQQNDQFLVSAESNVRNMLIGMRSAGDFGGPMMVGYCPDTFGNVSQMPQILRGFGIDNMLFGRGFNAGAHPRTEFEWESPDGSRILAIVMPLWYNNAERIPADPEAVVDMLDRLKNAMGPKAAVPHLLLMNGVDHLEPQYDLSVAIRLASERLRGDTLIHTNMPAYVGAVKASLAESGVELEVFRNELREDNHRQVLAGTLTTRMYLKQANHGSQTWLERYAEPVSTCAWTLGGKYPSGALTYAWKLLMQNHTHDSICGCGDDQAHREMEPRFRQVNQVAEDLTNRSIDHLARKIKTDADSLVVFNTLAWERTDKVRATVDLPLGDITYGEPEIDLTREARGFQITDAGGRPVPFAVTGSRIISTRTLIPSELPRLQMVKRFSIEFIAENVPAVGYKTYAITPAGSMPEFAGPPLFDGGALTNGMVRASFDRGALTVESLSDGRVYRNLNVFEDCGEAGDEYTRAKPARDARFTSAECEAQVSVIDRSPISATLRVEQTLMLPESATEDYSGRSERLVPCPVASYITVTRGISRVDIRTEVENNAKDHRLRVLFATGLDTEVSHADGHFDVVTRPIAVPKEWVNAATARPQQSWVDVNDGKSGLCLINRGLPEYELYDDEDRTLALTLLRCMARFVAGNEALALETAEAQCIGKHVFEYSIRPHAGNWERARVWRQANRFNAPLYVRQTGAHDGDLPAEMSFVEVEPAELVVTAIKKAESEDRLIVRFYNVGDEDVEGVVTVPGAKSCDVMNLNEEPVERLRVGDGGSVRLSVGGRRIVTLGFGFVGL
ncbi:MAG: glycoside hydrolase family 38 C-terminal domain-containing protein [Armatimonadota bacterium]|nr:glycoside hydrolase family 38 C-terminal domain-containing protein [Armatimonadota bacterium]